ncbi:HEAT repeat domain-containing protein [Janthinobacterium sp. 17J80-10]|uniref:HEAT repeat domain-containing protein n=1 Tax=Janthinobacterium sp. 17J80-10 TaxID=2497863 RepID=UPI0010055B07|nr:HEAT repeat domain-containing protein [Janthinobacterium sp. 17J80-10]QAU33739.1 HEAT repeat domain-containing protein [Janthinobacterium sp. 17J80-10]
MKTITAVLYGIGFCAAGAAAVWSVWSMSTDGPADAAATVAQSMAAASPARPAPAGDASGLWAWGNPGTSAGKIDEPVDVLLAKAMRPSSKPAEGDDPRDKLRKLAKDDPGVVKQLMASYDKESSTQARQLIVSLLSSVEKPEILAFSKRLATSRDMAQRKDGFVMLQNLSGDAPDIHPIILQALYGDKSPDVIMLALAALKPPADNNPSQPGMHARDAAAIVAQLQHLTRNADPNIRLQSILQLAQWDKADSSQAQWSQALADQSPQVRQAAVTAVAQSGTQSDAVKAALIGMANNPNESRDVRGNALQVLEAFVLSKDEAATLSQSRSQILGL